MITQQNAIKVQFKFVMFVMMSKICLYGEIVDLPPVSVALFLLTIDRNRDVIVFLSASRSQHYERQSRVSLRFYGLNYHFKPVSFENGFSLDSFRFS